MTFAMTDIMTAILTDVMIAFRTDITTGISAGVMTTNTTCIMTTIMTDIGHDDSHDCDGEMHAGDADHDYGYVFEFCHAGYAKCIMATRSDEYEYVNTCC